MMLVTLDGPDDQCNLCRGPAVWVAGESLVENENQWFVERLCTACGMSYVNGGRGIVIRLYRDAALRLLGRHRISVEEDAAAVPVMQLLRRIYGLSIPETQQRRRELLRAGLTGTPGEMAWLRAELTALGVAVTVREEVPGAQTELPERPVPTPPYRIVDGASGEPVEITDPAERERFAAYLHGATCLIAGGYWADPGTRDPRDRSGHALMSDGTFAWSLAWAILRPRHDLPLPEDFVGHVRARGYEPPSLSDDQVAALLIATGLERPTEEP